MKLNMFSFDMSNINIFIVKKSFFFNIFPYFSHPAACVSWGHNSEDRVTFPRTFILCHFTIDFYPLLFVTLRVSKCDSFFVCFVIKKIFMTWNMENSSAIFLWKWEKRAMSTVSTVSFIEHEKIAKYRWWWCSLGGVFDSLIYPFTQTS